MRNRKYEKKIKFHAGNAILGALPTVICAWNIRRCTPDDFTVPYVLLTAMVITFLFSTAWSVYLTVCDISEYRKWRDIVSRGEKYSGQLYCDKEQHMVDENGDTCFPVFLRYGKPERTLKLGTYAYGRDADTADDCTVFVGDGMVAVINKEDVIHAKGT